MEAKDKNDFRVIYLKNIENEIIHYMASEVRNVLYRIGMDKLASAEEIRLRADKPLMIRNYEGDWFVEPNGSLSSSCGNPVIISQNVIMKTFELMSENSVYAYQDEIRNGFITLKGGHRIGISGKTVMEGISVRNIKDISGLNIRLSKEVKGCAEKVIRHIMGKNSSINNTLIISPPECGKTTLLRDIARMLSDGIAEYGFKGVKIGIVDERSEIAACYRGVPQNDVGVRTDVLDGCPKSSGMIMMIRSMSPQVIVTDEIGNRGDKEAINQVINAGVKLVTTAHGYNISELKSRQEVISLIDDKVFERYIVLDNSKGPGTISEIVDGSTMKKIYGGM